MTNSTKTKALLADFSKDEEVAFLLYKEVLEEAFRADGLKAVLQMSQDAVAHSICVAQIGEQKRLSMSKLRAAVASGLTGNWAPGMMKFLTELKAKGGLEKLIGKQ